MILAESELATAHVAGGARGYIVFPCRECFPPKRFKIAFGIASSALFHALTIAHGNLPGVKGGYLGVKIEFPSEMAQNFWMAAFAFTVCFVLTLMISLATSRTKSDDQLKGLVYSLTPKIVDHNVPVWQRPAVVGTALLIACVILNFIFW